MWKPISLQFINFQSHIDTLYEYSSSLECIQGINLDIEDEQDKDKESNGSGKSVLIEGEYFSLLDSPLREDIRIEDLIYDKDPDIKGAETIFILENNFLDLKLKIHRKIWFKKSSELFLYTCKLKEEFTEKPNEEFSSVGEGDKRIIELLGVQREDLINYYIISKKKYKSFYRSSDDKKKEIVARFSGGYLIEGLDKEIENDIEKENDKLKIQDDKILFLNSKIEVHEEEIEKIKNKNIEEEKNERIEGIKETILSVENKIHSLLITRKDLNQSIKEAEDLLKIEESKSLDTKDKSKFSIKIEKLNNDKKVIKEKKIEYTNQMKGLKEELKEWEDFLIDVEKNVRGSVICPKCAHEFNISDGTLNIEDLKKKIPEIKQNIEDVKKEIEELQNKEKTEIEDILDKIDKDIEVCEKEITLIETAEDKLSEAIRKFKNKIKEIKENLESNEKSEITYHKQISILEKDIEEIKKEEIIDKSKEHIIAIEKIKKELIEIEKEKIKINEIIENKVQWIYLFTSFRSHLANKAIKNIEGQANLFFTRNEIRFANTTRRFYFISR